MEIIWNLGNKNVILLKRITERSYFSQSVFEVFIGIKTINFKNKIKINDTYKMTFDPVKFHGKNKRQVAIINKYSKNTLTGWQNTVQWHFSQWNLTKRIQNRTSNAWIFAEHDLPRHRKNDHKIYERNYYGKAITCGTVEFFIWECQSYYK